MTSFDQQIKKLLDTNRESAIRMLAEKFSETIYWHARRMVVIHEDAEDVLQESFFRIVRSIDGFKWESALSSWIYRIATNESLRVLEQRKKQIPAEDIDAFTENLGTQEFVDMSDALVVKLQAAIHTLPTKQQLVFNLRYYDELPYDQIAEIMDSTPSAAKMNYHHAKEKVKKLMLA